MSGDGQDAADEEKLSFLSSAEMQSGGSQSMESGGMQPINVSSGSQEASSSSAQQDGGVIGYFKKAAHPKAAFFHLLFKLGAIGTYIFGTLFTTNYVLIFVLCVLLLAFDFWTVKNVTGRLMVGLRWESRLREDGSSFWVYEALQDKSRISRVDSTIFWGGMWLAPIWWALLLIIGILKFNVSWLLIVAVALTLNGINLLGFIRCRKGAKKQAEQAMTSLMTQGALSAVMKAPGLIGSTIFGRGSGDQDGGPRSSTLTV